ncbi:MAG: ribonuclease III domain-containing protein [Lachnospiraceae bacterium]|nr:ribonuclease III domain-containing protein [Lachnospiraceae bacterium]
MEESLVHNDIRKIIESQFGEAKTDLKAYSPLTLAFIGDAVYSLIIRTIIVERGNVPVNKLHKATTSLVQANAQAEMIQSIQTMLTEEEESAYRRGRNAKSGSSAKNASIQTYRKATGMESLVGYLYLKGDYERILELMKKGLSIEESEKE